MPKVSVIIPIYGVEKYIKRCAESLFSQTLDDIEYIFVNDCTPDNSISILEETIRKYPQRSSQIKIINNELNKGSAATRQVGMKVATGEYIIHCDSDDWVDSDTYEKAYDKAIEDGADIVFFGAYWEYYEYTKPEYPFGFKDSDDAFKASLSGIMHNATWNKLVRRSVYTENHIEFTPGLNMQEDVSVMPRLFYFAKKISTLGGCYYHYFQGNTSSYIHQWKPSHFQNCIDVVNLLKNFITKEGVYDEYSRYLAYYQCFIKSAMLYYCQDKTKLKDIFELFPEANEFIDSCPTIDDRSKKLLKSYKRLVFSKKRAKLKRTLHNGIKFISGK